MKSIELALDKLGCLNGLVDCITKSLDYDALVSILEMPMGI